MNTLRWHRLNHPTSKWRVLLFLCATATVIGCITGSLQAQNLPCETPATANTNIALARFNTDGTLDPTFGEAGIRQLDLGCNAENVSDTVWNLERDAQDRLIVFGATKGAETRVDRDRVVIRFTADGALDTTFATGGIHTLDLANLNDNARKGIVLPDGKLLASGYANQPTGVGSQSANHVVLLQLNGDGTPDLSFGFEGVANVNPFVPDTPTPTPWGMVEAYGVGRQSTGNYVTAGYGRTAAEGTVDVVSLRFTPDGAIDPTWGTDGAVLLDLIGEDDRGRNMVVLPDNRVLIVGTATPVSMSGDALAVILNPDGTFDTTFDTDGWKVYDFGRTDEQFYGAALAPSGNWAAAAGYSTDDISGSDATLLLLPLPGGADLSQVVALAAAEDDRFWGVTFDASDNVYAAGFVTMGGDSQTAVARFTTDGVLDPTFGTAGVATVNLITSAAAAEEARSVVIQSDGKIVVAGTVVVAEAPVAP